MKEAVDSEDGKLWKEAMVDEMASLHKKWRFGYGGVSGWKETHWQKMGVQEE